MPPGTDCTACGSEPTDSPHAMRGSQINLKDRERSRLAPALLLSLLIHVLLLGLTFDGQAWVGGLGSLWQVRKNDGPDLRVLLVPPDTATHHDAALLAKQRQQTIVDQPAASSAPSTPPASPAPTPGSFAVGIVPGASATASSQSEPVATSTEAAKPAIVPEARRDLVQPKPKAGPEARRSRPAVVAGASSGKPRVRADRSRDAVVTSAPPDVIALERSDEATWTVPVTPTEPDVAIAAAPGIA